MGFFATFWTWLNGQLAAYIGENTAKLANILEPAIVTLATVYVMAWGYLHLTGKIEEPLLTGLKRIALLGLIMGAGLHLWLYNTLIVDTFYNAPAQLASAVIGSNDPVSTLDTIWDRGGRVADFMLLQSTSSTWPNFADIVMAFVVWAIIAVLCVYAMFLIALSSVALAVLLALGPLFIATLLFAGTRRFFAAWMSQLATYALITILTIMIAALMLGIVQSYASQTAALGPNLTMVDVLHMLLIAVLVLLILRQVMPIAGSLAGGAALSSFGLFSSLPSKAINSVMLYRAMRERSQANARASQAATAAPAITDSTPGAQVRPRFGV